MAHHGGFHNPGKPHDIARGEEIVAHKTLHPILAAVAGVAHAGTDHRLQIEGEAVFHPGGDVMHVKTHGPQKIPTAAQAAQFLLIEQVYPPVGQLGGGKAAVGGAHHPVQGLQITQAAAAFFDVGFN